MNSCVLERQVVVESPETPATYDEVYELRLQLAEKSRVKGYSFLWDTLHSPRLIPELRKTLLTLGIQPFSLTSVEEYKRQARKRLNRRITFVFSIGLGLLLLAPFLMVGGFRYNNSWLITGFAASAITGLIIMSFSSFMKWNWQRVLLSAYRRPIPEFVLETVCRISDRMPQATLWIEELTRPQEVRDPFLVVQAGTTDTVQEIYYVEVFEESRFEGFERKKIRERAAVNVE